MSSATQYGPGDPQTWGRCTGHPLDPRTPDVDPELPDCAHCGKPIDGEVRTDSSGESLCDACYDAAPWFSNCCGYEARGIDLDMQICGDCHDHCEYVK